MSDFFEILKNFLPAIVVILILWLFVFFLRVTIPIDQFPWDLISLILGWIVSYVQNYRKEKRENEKLNNLENYLLRNDTIPDLKTKYTDFLDYRFTGIGLYGRKEECKRLDEFISKKTYNGKMKKRCLWTITGYGGIGKSKLAFHTALKYKRKKWKVLWVDHIKIKQVLEIDRKECKINGNLLIICDYAGVYTNEIATLITKLETTETACVRFLLLDRVIHSDSTQNWYDNFKESCSNNGISLRDIEFDKIALNIENSISSIDPYYKMLTDMALSRLREMNKDSRAIKRIYYEFLLKFSSIIDWDYPTEGGMTKIEKVLMDIKENCGVYFLDFYRFIAPDFMCYFTRKEVEEIKKWLSTDKKLSKSNGFPVFFLLVGDNCLSQKINKGEFELDQIDLDNIAREFIEKMMRTFFHKWRISDEEIKEYVSNLLVISTALNQKIDKINVEYYNQYSHPISTYYERDLKLTNNEFSCFFSSIEPVTPDLIGEFFVIEHFNKLKADDRLNLTMAFTNYHGTFIEFLKRLLQDWIRHKETGEFFENLAKCIQNSTKKQVKDFAEEMLKIICDCISNRDELLDVSFFLFYHEAVETLRAICLNDNVNQHLIRFYRKGLAYRELQGGEIEIGNYYKRIDELETAEALKRSNTTSQQEELV